VLAPSCRLVASSYPILRIWQLNQDGAPGEERVSLDDGGDAILVRRDAKGVSLARIGAGQHAWLSALAADKALGEAIEAAQTAEATFDLGTALRARIADATISGIGAS
jgi:hypothetical protein